MKNIFVFIIVCVFGYSQEKELKIELAPIKSYDSTATERVFWVEYTIENISDKEIAFFLLEDQFFSTQASALQPIVSYSVFQNNKLFEVGSIFTSYRKYFNSQADFELYQKQNQQKINEEIENAKTDSTYFLKKSSAELMKSIKTLKPKEKLTQNKVLFWNKKRYFKQHDLEYYLNEDNLYHFQLNFVVLKEEYKAKLTPQDFIKIENNPNFIKGWFTSNKVEINFK